MSRRRGTKSAGGQAGAGRSYPNFTTAEGQNALFSLTTGSANTAVGWFSLWGNAEGSFNTATGAGRSFSTPQTQMRRLARPRFYSIPPAKPT